MGRHRPGRADGGAGGGDGRRPVATPGRLSPAPRRCGAPGRPPPRSRPEVSWSPAWWPCRSLYVVGLEVVAVEGLVALAVHGGLPAQGEQHRSRRPDRLKPASPPPSRPPGAGGA
jgi:hypothetical protein